MTEETAKKIIAELAAIDHTLSYVALVLILHLLLEGAKCLP